MLHSSHHLTRRLGIFIAGVFASVGCCLWVYSSFTSSVDAGEPDKKVSARIIGGTVANKRQFRNVGVLKEGSFRFCTGTVIAPRWVLTAGHCVEGITPNNYRGYSFELSGWTNFQWKNVYIHPTYNFPDGDVALIELKTAVPKSITPASLRTIAPSVGENMTIVGFGLTGTGQTGTTGGAGIKRIGRVILDEIDPFFVIWNFDAPEVNNTAPGDSGGPGFIDGLLASVTSGGKNDFAEWGDVSFNTRVDVYRTWIDQTMASSSNGIWKSGNWVPVPLAIRVIGEPTEAAAEVVNSLPEDGFGVKSIRSFISKW